MSMGWLDNGEKVIQRPHHFQNFLFSTNTDCATIRNEGEALVFIRWFINQCFLLPPTVTLRCCVYWLTKVPFPHRFLMPLGLLIHCLFHCSHMELPKKQRKSCWTLCTKTLIFGLESLSGKETHGKENIPVVASNKWFLAKSSAVTEGLAFHDIWKSNKTTFAFWEL